MSSSAARTLLEKIYELCDTLDETPVGIKNLVDSDLTSRKVFFVEVSKFIMYLSASDGNVSWAEANYIGDLMGGAISPSQITDLIKENNIYSTQFEKEVPMTLKLFVKADNMLADAGKLDGNYSSDLLINFYEALGQDFCNCDSVGGNEREDLAIYLGTLRDYVRSERNTAGQKSSFGGNSLKAKYEILKKN